MIGALEVMQLWTYVVEVAENISVGSGIPQKGARGSREYLLVFASWASSKRIEEGFVSVLQTFSVALIF